MKGKLIMQKTRKKLILFISLIFIFFTSGVYFILSFTIPENTVIYSGEKDSCFIPEATSWLLSSGKTPSSPVMQNSAKKLTSSEKEHGYTTTVYLCNFIPVKTVRVSVIDETAVTPGGQAVGINLRTKGILVANLSDIKLSTGEEVCPAKDAGLRPGDIIEKINGEKMTSKEDVVKAVENSSGILNVEGTHHSDSRLWKIKPAYDKNGSIKIGAWVRDTVAGVGTLTYCTDEGFGALGHPISDIDTGNYVESDGGSIFEARVVGIDKSEKGEPGSIRAVFSGSKIGEIRKNSDCGVFGISSVNSKNKIPVASKKEITPGDAEIICDIGNGVERFDVAIRKIINGTDASKSILIQVTDEELLEKTGGIVQGMSGSPLVQNGKLIGAVTHVFVNDPTRGYGIFIENMLAEAEKIK